MRRRTARRRWPARVVGFTAMSAMVLAGVPAAADQPVARGIDRVCPAPSVVGDPDGDRVGFSDLDTPHAGSITCASDYGIVTGFPDATFRPGQAITRGQMATFVTATLRTATGFALPAPAERRFSDIDGHVHAEAIDAISEAGIVSGRPDGTFGPDDTLTRGQFTRAVANAISYADVFAVGGPLPPDDDRVSFPDIVGTTFEDSILALGGIGVALGTADGGFHPQGEVTRGQMTTFLMRSADYLDRYQRWRPTAQRSVVITAELDLVSPLDADAPEAPSVGAGSVVLVVHAFNGTLSYSLDLSELPGPYEPSGATLHRGDPVAGSPAALTVADATKLEDAVGGIVTGVVLEAESSERFADVLFSPEEFYLELTTSDAVHRGVLHAAAS